MLKCKICGKEFEANLDRHYVARDNGKTGITVAISNSEEKLYDAFDCPACGCQVVVQERKRQYIVPNEVEANEEEEVEEEVEEEDKDRIEKKPTCFGNFEGYVSGYCDECDYYKGCVFKTLKKQNKRGK